MGKLVFENDTRNYEIANISFAHFLWKYSKKYKEKSILYKKRHYGIPNLSFCYSNILLYQKYE